MSNVYTFEPKNASPETLREALIANTKAEYTKNQELHTKVAVIVERVK